LLGDAVHGQPGGFQQLSGAVDTHGGQQFQRGGGAIPGKYKLLMGMVTDAIAAHPDGVRDLANAACAAGA
jgi:hypothetical protein